jgi:hypothetical protein
MSDRSIQDGRIVAAAWALVAVMREQDYDYDNDPDIRKRKQEAEDNLRKIVEGRS